ncbi:hypothetical protein [Brasilonema sp. UFV-L1]|uniref:hypothetical protein n=1 Tax=Brasilonema sp. UFV-L1 TaxID=2234130 RepID=UPI00145F3C5E
MATLLMRGNSHTSIAQEPDFPRTGPIKYTSFIHPTAKINTKKFLIGAQSLIEGFVTLEGQSALLGHASDLQDNDRLLNYANASRGLSHPGDLVIGDGSFTAHGVTFIGKVRIGDACGTVINAVVQNARIGDASITGFTAQILGEDPANLIEIPEASLVLFGARIRSQADVAANIIPVPAAFSLFASDVDQENVLLARAYNLLYRAAARLTPFSADENSPGNPGSNFPDVAQAFGKLSVAPPTVDRRGTGVIPARQASLNDLSFEVFGPLSPLPSPSTPAPDAGGLNAPPSSSPEAGARFLAPRVASPELVDNNAIVLGGVELAEGVVVGRGSYLHGGDSPGISVGRGTRIGQNTSVHELTFTSVRIGSGVTIGNRVVLHGPLEIGNNVTVGDRAVLFGPRIAEGVTIGAGVLVFGPVEVTRDIPAGTIIVAPGNETLIAPSHRTGWGAAQPSPLMLAEWQQAREAGGGCGCGVGAMIHVSA